jgi:hypothetical protein
MFINILSVFFATIHCSLPERRVAENVAQVALDVVADHEVGAQSDRWVVRRGLGEDTRSDGATDQLIKESKLNNGANVI